MLCYAGNSVIDKISCMVGTKIENDFLHLMAG